MFCFHHQHLERSRFDRATVQGSNLALQFTLQAGLSCQVQARDLLPTGAWQTVTNINPSSLSTNLTISVPIQTNNRFFRLEALF